MAETTRLSVGQALDKLRGSAEAKSKSTLHNDRIDSLNEEIKRLRATRQRLEQDQGGGPIKK